MTEKPRAILINGDCYKYLPRIGTEKVAALITDPPYGDDFDTDFTRFTGGANVERSVHKKIIGDEKDFNPLPFMRFNKNMVLWGSNRFSDLLPVGSLLIWDKRSTNGNKNVMSDGESAWWSKGRGVYIFSHTWDGFNRASERGTKYHPTQKPAALFRWVIEKICPGRGYIFDPFMGSGPCGVAAVEMGFDYIGFERDPEHFRTATGRIAETGARVSIDF